LPSSSHAAGQVPAGSSLSRPDNDANSPDPAARTATPIQPPFCAASPRSSSVLKFPSCTSTPNTVAAGSSGVALRSLPYNAICMS